MDEKEREREAEREKGKKGKQGEIMSRFVECVHLASHPSAGLFELFAFRDVLLCLLHMFQSLQHTPLNVVHQLTLHTNKRRSHCSSGESRNLPKALSNNWKTSLMNV